MRRSGWRLALAAALFAVWIGYLAYLAATTTRPVVLRRPQFLVADAYVIAEIRGHRYWLDFPELAVAPAGIAAAAVLPDDTDGEGPGDIALVQKVVWAAKPGDWTRVKLFVRNLRHSGAKFGWQGPGQYVLALSKSANDGRGACFLTAIPRTPGFPGSATELPARESPSFIYPLTTATRRQVDDLTAEYHR
jgi:hypothetical protein